ncbi:MAG: hypothetical protein ACYDHC_11055 [Desulfuromonadaceae bacterium]
MDVNRDIIPLISAITALVAVLVGPIVTIRVAHKTVISPMRQVWINNLRDAIADFLATAEKSDFQYYKHGETDLNKRKARQKIWERLSHIEAKITLMINPDESDHLELLAAITGLMCWSGDNELSYEKMTEQDEGELSNFEKRRQTIVNISRKILKEEWEVVKAG